MKRAFVSITLVTLMLLIPVSADVVDIFEVYPIGNEYYNTDIIDMYENDHNEVPIYTQECTANTLYRFGFTLCMPLKKNYTYQIYMKLSCNLPMYYNKYTLFKIGKKRPTKTSEGTSYIDKLGQSATLSGDEWSINLVLNTNSDNISITENGIYYLTMLGDGYTTTGNFTVRLTDVKIKCYSDANGDIYDELINIGAGGTIPDGDSLAEAQNKLNSSESELSSKSDNLVSKVSTQWESIKSQLKPSTMRKARAASEGTAFNNVYGMITGIMPDNLKLAFLAIPMLMFIGWILGRLN